MKTVKTSHENKRSYPYLLEVVDKNRECIVFMYCPGKGVVVHANTSNQDLCLGHHSEHWREDSNLVKVFHGEITISD
jgi:hypothetical protein